MTLSLTYSCTDLYDGRAEDMRDCHQHADHSLEVIHHRHREGRLAADPDSWRREVEVKAAHGLVARAVVIVGHRDLQDTLHEVPCASSSWRRDRRTTT